MGIDHWVSRDWRIESALATLESQDVWKVGIGGLFVAAAGVPVGFLLYQVYFYIRWNSPIASRGLIPPLIHGRSREIDAVLDILKEYGTGESGYYLGLEWRRRAYAETMSTHQSRWNYLTTIIRDSIAGEVDRSSIEAYNRHLIDLLHGLGASMIGFILGFFLYLLERGANPGYLVLSIIAIVICIFFVHVERRRQRVVCGYGLESPLMVRCLSVVPSYSAEWFVVLLWSFIVLASPLSRDVLSEFACAVSSRLQSDNCCLPNHTYGRSLALLGLAVLGFIWCVKQRSVLARWITGGTFLVIVLAAELAVRYPWFEHALASIDYDWATVHSILVMLAIMIAFITNRDNVNDTLLGFQRFYLRKHLELNHHRVPIACEDSHG